MGAQAPTIARTIDDLRAQTPSGTLALVPTMGALHGGHLSLVRRARETADAVMVSVYVNPLQFAPNEDFAEYPRDLQSDCEKLKGLADIVFAPDDKTMYPQKQQVTIALPPLADELCGKSRPGFFHGVTTAVCKLLNITRPDFALFGKKDYQQLRLIEMMARELNFNTKIIECETVRESDGLALSSRNAYLTKPQRQTAPLLRQTLQTTATAIESGADGKQECASAKQKLRAAGFTPDYMELRESQTLSPPQHGKPAVILAAATLGKARLLDNIELTIP